MTTRNGTDIIAQRGGLAVSASRNADIWKMGEALCRSELVPKHFQGKPANMFLALQLADRMDLDMFAVMSNLYVVHGTPAFSAKFLIGLANLRGPFKGSLKFRTEGAGTAALAVTCYATHAETGEEVSKTATLAMAREAGWTKNAKYKEMPEQMLTYRAATFFVRAFCPEVTLMGARTVDEVEDIHAAESEPRDTYAEVAADPLSRELAGETENPAGEAGGVAVAGKGEASAQPVSSPTSPDEPDPVDEDDLVRDIFND